jgi:hypothetical protein
MTEPKDHKDGKPPIALPAGSFEMSEVVKLADKVPAEGEKRDTLLAEGLEKLNATKQQPPEDQETAPEAIAKGAPAPFDAPMAVAPVSIPEPASSSKSAAE